MQKINKGDNVKMMRGKDAGKTGEVLQVIRPTGKAKEVKLVVKGINMVKKHQKPNPTLNLPGGILEIEKPVSVSNVMLLEGKDVVRVKTEITEKGKNRVSSKSGKIIK